MTLTITDLFCGAGGSSLGATAVPGVELRIAANHWQLAVDSHAANFPDADHDVADISAADPRRYPRTDILWASPECTNHSQAKGRRRDDGQPDLFGEVLPDAAAERSRATMWDVPRFAEHHLYRAVVVENVVDAAKWVMFPAWMQAMDLLGYDHQIVYLNSMHAPALATPRAPQSRDRMYVVFWRRGDHRPDLAIRPAAWCPTCDREVAAVQSWKRPDRTPWGRYRQQYVYRCPNVECRYRIVEPYALPAAAAIDWTMPGLRIGDRPKPLSLKTLARIEAGLAKYARPMTFEARGNTFVRPDSGYARAWPVDQPTATLTTTETRALLVPSGGTWNEEAQPIGCPMRARTTRENEGLLVPVEGRDAVYARPTSGPMRSQTARHQDALVVPYYGSETDADLASDPLRTLTSRDRFGLAFMAELRGGYSDHRPVTDPLSAVTAGGNHHMLVRHNTARDGRPGAEMCTPVEEPTRTITTAGHQSLVGWGDPPAVEDCTFRMLEPSEIQAAMAFRSSYNVLGNRRERVRQLGNAVTPPAAEYLIRAVAEALRGAA
jgi:DNA (cytosine-5)-methyltransferase 1